MSRLAAVQDVLDFDVPIDVARCVAAGGTHEVAYPCGLTLRVTPKMAQVIVGDPSESVLEAVEGSGRSFLVVP